MNKLMIITSLLVAGAVAYFPAMPSDRQSLGLTESQYLDLQKLVEETRRLTALYYGVNYNPPEDISEVSVLLGGMVLLHQAVCAQIDSLRSRMENRDGVENQGIDEICNSYGVNI